MSHVIASRLRSRSSSSPRGARVQPRHSRHAHTYSNRNLGNKSTIAVANQACGAPKRKANCRAKWPTEGLRLVVCCPAVTKPPRRAPCRIFKHQTIQPAVSRGTARSTHPCVGSATTHALHARASPTHVGRTTLEGQGVPAPRPSDLGAIGPKPSPTSADVVTRDVLKRRTANPTAGLWGHEQRYTRHVASTAPTSLGL